MPEIGQPSHILEEDEFTDIHIDTERLIGYAPVAPVQSESEEDEDVRVEASEPVRGGVTRFGGENDDGDDDETDEATEADLEEGPEEAEPAEYHDDMGTTADDIIEELTTRSVQLEDRVAHLEEQNMVHQEREDQYRDLAYQREEESRELRQALEQSNASRAELQSLHLATRAELELERADRTQLGEAWLRSALRVDVLEGQVQDRSARIDTLEHVLATACVRLRDRVRRYPRDSGSSRRVIRRRVVDRIARQELRGAVRRSRR